MKSAVQIIQEYSSNIFINEDGVPLSIKLTNGVSIEKLIFFEKENNIILPSCLKELLLFSDGVELFGVQILPLEKMNFFSNEGVLLFHEWGDGDSDGVLFKDQVSSGEVVFIHHSIDNLSYVSPSLDEWVDSVIEEVRTKGALLHPSDYSNRDEIGMYSKLKINL